MKNKHDCKAYVHCLKEKNRWYDCDELKAENAILREALERIVGMADGDISCLACDITDLASDALHRAGGGK